MGKHLARRLSKSNRVISVDLADSGKPGKNIERVSLDIAGDLSPIPRSKNAIFVHTAALMQAKDLHAFWRVNVEGTKNLLEWSLENNTSHFIYLSTGGVYGYDKSKAMKENDAIDPIGLYGYTKWIGENIAMMVSRWFGLPVTVMRLYFPYGPGQKSGVFPLILHSIRDGRALTIKHDGAPRFQPIYIDDLVNAIEKVAGSPGGFRIYNVCGNDAVSFLEIVRMVEKESGREAKLIFSEEDEGHLLADNTKIKQELGWEPKTGLARGIREFIKSDTTA